MFKNQSNFLSLWISIKLYIDVLSQKYDSIWRTRKRIIGTAFLIVFIFKLVLGKNKQGYNSILVEMWHNLVFTALPFAQKKPLAASSVCEARMKLPEQIFKDLNSSFVKEFEKTNNSLFWNGYRLFGIDGSKINLPRELIAQGYNIHSKLAYYPQGLLSCLYELSTELPYDFDLVSHGNERECAIKHLHLLGPKDIVIMDRGYFSYFLLRQFFNKNVKVIFRLQRKAGKAFNAFWNSNKLEDTIMLPPSPKALKKLKNKNAQPIPLRLIKYTISGKTYVLATTLFGEQFSRQTFSELYHLRWFEEEAFKVSKNLINVEDFHAKSLRGIKQELFAHFCIITLSRILEHKATLDINPKLDSNNYAFRKFSQTLKINFKNCILVISKAIEDIVFLKIPIFISSLLPKLMISISRLYHKIRPNRQNRRISHKPRTKWSPA